MARSLRIFYPGAVYHVMNRGVGRKTIFHNASCYQIFLELLDDVTRRYQAEIQAYCIMSNHYHLCIRTLSPNLKEIMRYINGVFTQKNNRMNKSDGAIFRGRYKAILVDNDSYLLQISRYIHLNPVEAKIVLNPEDYPWSSYSYYIGKLKKPVWLHCDEVLEHFSGLNRVDSYKKFVLDGVDFKTKEFYVDSEKIPILGDQDFIKKIKNHHIAARLDKAIPQQGRIIKRLLPSINNIIQAVGIFYNVEPSKIIMNKNRRLGNLARRISIYMSCEDSGKTHKEIASQFIGLSTTSISKIHHRVKIEIKENKRLFDEIENIKLNLSIVRL